MRKIICLLLAVLLLLPSTASATNWVFVANGQIDQYPTFRSYIDADTAVRLGDTVIYWRLLVWDEPYRGYTRFLYKEEAKLTDPMQIRDWEVYLYDRDGRETVESTVPENTFRTVRPGTIYSMEIDAAQKNARAISDAGPKPQTFPK